MNCLIIGGILHGEPEQSELFQGVCYKIGKYLAKKGNNLSICSPFEDSADYWVLKGYLESRSDNSQRIYFFYIDTEEVRLKVENLKKI